MNRLYKIFVVLTAILMMSILPCPIYAATTMARAVTLSDHYFDDAVFVGDSISLKLENYVDLQRQSTPDFLGSAEFLTTGGLGSGNAQLPVTEDSLHPQYDGYKMPIEDSVAATGAKKMYIMFGMNDIVPYGIDGAVENLETLIDKILQKSPHLVVAVESVTPILADKQQKNLNNHNIEIYNHAVREMCARRGFAYLDIYSQLKGNDGGLNYNYCGDAPSMGMHLSNSGCVPWVSYLRSHPITVENIQIAEPEVEDEVQVEVEDEDESKPITIVEKEKPKPTKPWRPKLKGRLLY